MKIKLLILFFLVVFMFVGCNKINDSSNSSEPSSIAPTPIEEPQIDYSIFEEPESAYAAFLNNLYSGDEDPKNLYEKDELDYYGYDDDMEFYYVTKDLDNDGTLELLIKNNHMNVAVYTYDEDLKKVGNIVFSTGTSRFLYSNNPDYPYIFYFGLGGGLNHYGYVSIKDNQLVYEELWNEDYSGWRENRIEEFSKDKGLINESKIVYSKGNDIEWIAVESLDR